MHHVQIGTGHRCHEFYAVKPHGRDFYEISVSRGRGKSRLTRRWYPPDGWSRKAIEREFTAVAAEFERQSDAGEIVTCAERRELEAREAAEATKILTLRQYGERVFINCTPRSEHEVDPWGPGSGIIKVP